MHYTEIKCKQGTEEWFTARLGMLTASNADKIITKTGKLSASSEELINRAVAEMILGEREETFQSDAMARGNELEEEALERFNFSYGYDFKPCGFYKSIHGGYGFSLDGVDEKNQISLELKCPLSHTHVAYLSNEGLPAKYFQQVQFQLMVTGFEKSIFGSYHPKFKSLHVEVLRDEKFIKSMNEYVKKCTDIIAERYEKLKTMKAA